MGQNSPKNMAGATGKGDQGDTSKSKKAHQPLPDLGSHNMSKNTGTDPDDERDEHGQFTSKGSQGLQKY